MKLFRSSTADTKPESVRPPAADSGGLFARMAKTRDKLANGLAGFFGGGRALDDALFDDLHDQLLLADVGVDASDRIINRLKRDANQDAGQDTDPGRLIESLRRVLIEILKPCEHPLPIDPARAGDPERQSMRNKPSPAADTRAKPFIILMVGVNGVGKTTTLAKLAARLSRHGHKVMLAACDTFRAAAIEQLQTWGRRLEIPVIAHSHGADPAAVAHDAYHAARAREIDVLLIDTAGRQHTHDNLMEQLKKIVRVLRKVNPAAPDEILLTVDAGNGRNVISQVEHFQQAIGLHGLCVAKLDGTAKGGVLVALAEQFGLPVRYIGVGQAEHDLRQFSADEFAAALLPPRATP